MRLKNEILIIVSVVLLAVPATVAGQQSGQPAGQAQNSQAGQQSQPLAPVSAEEPTQAPEGGPPASTTEDARSFGGAESYSVGPAGLSRGFFVPSIEFSEMGDSNFSLSSGHPGFETIDTLVGRIDYKKVARRYQTTVEYMGGATIYNRHSDLDTSIQQFGITESYQGRRWSLLLDNRTSYLPESSLGYGGFGFGGGLGVDLGGATGSILSNINPALNPSGAILTARGSRVYSTSVAQVQYLTGARSALTFALSFGLLHFNQGGVGGSRNGTAMLGYSHSFSARDYIGLNYAFSGFRFPGGGTSFNTHLLQAKYGHRISGRMSMEVGAGPQVNVVKSPVTGSTTNLTWSASGNLDYRARRGDLGVNYFRNATNGGGVLNGATTDNVSLAWSANLKRRWYFSLGPGYSHNRSIPLTSNSPNQNTYDTEYASASLSRMFGRYTSMFLTYTYQTQNSNTTSCLVAPCSTSLQRNLIGFGFDFHPRQISLE
ncbi:MAG TPA: hypothetical protein VKV95_08190 [Terriglobia bacterium]|nr:hypothetical protein [Terriglobia bacterium]